MALHAIFEQPILAGLPAGYEILHRGKTESHFLFFFAVRISIRTAI
jgi:hypothetical protein